mgnify:CR=1 FL=1
MSFSKRTPCTGEIRGIRLIIEACQQHKIDYTKYCVELFESYYDEKKCVCVAIYKKYDIDLFNYITKNNLTIQIKENIIMELSKLYFFLESINLVHYDIKSENIVVEKLKNGMLRLRLIDFEAIVESGKRFEPHTFKSKTTILHPDIVKDLLYDRSIETSTYHMEFSINIIIKIMTDPHNDFINKYHNIINRKNSHNIKYILSEINKLYNELYKIQSDEDEALLQLCSFVYKEYKTSVDEIDMID